MADENAFQESLHSLSRFLVDDATVADTLQRIIDIAAGALPPAKYIGITMLVDDRVTTSVFTDADVCEIDQAQYDADTGPCIDSYRDGVRYEIPSTEQDRKWPEFSRAAFEHGIRSTLSLPLIAGTASLGAVNFYSDIENGFDDADREIAAEFVGHAAVVLANASAYWDARSLAERVTEAMGARATIEQAKGIIMAQSHVDPDAAFDLLRLASQRENRKLRDIAQELVARHSGSTSAGREGE